MPRIVLSELTTSITELKRDPIGTVAAGEGSPVVVFHRNEPAFYCVPATTFEAIVERLEDFELNEVADARKGEARVRADLDEI
jgi:antitoxin StbD